MSRSSEYKWRQSGSCQNEKADDASKDVGPLGWLTEAVQSDMAPILGVEIEVRASNCTWSVIHRSPESDASSELRTLGKALTSIISSRNLRIEPITFFYFKQHNSQWHLLLTLHRLATQLLCSREISSKERFCFVPEEVREYAEEWQKLW